MADINSIDFTQKDNNNIFSNNRPPIYISKSEYDLASLFVNPSSKTSFENRVFTDDKGIRQIGQMPTQFDEINTIDIPTANYDSDDVLYVNALTTVLDDLQHIFNTYNIDTRPLHQFYRRELGVYSSITKGKDFKLAKHVLIKKSEQRQAFRDDSKQKKSFFGKDDRPDDEW